MSLSEDEGAPHGSAVKPNDPLTLTVAAAILAGAVLLAGFVPARRASRIDPVAAILCE